MSCAPAKRIELSRSVDMPSSWELDFKSCSGVLSGLESERSDSDAMNDFCLVWNIDSRETEFTKLVEMLFHHHLGLVSNNKNRTQIQSKLLIYTRSSVP